jgi:hypothetical protein
MIVNVQRRLGVILALLLLMSAAATALDFTPAGQPLEFEGDLPAPPRLSPDDHSWDCYLRVYIVQDSSTYYNDAYGHYYEMGFLKFAYNQMVTLTYGDTLRPSITWNGAMHGFSGITEDNIRVIAVVFAPDWYWGWSYPSGHTGPFHVHEVQAAASAIPGTTGYEDASGEFSHHVFLEEGTANG